ncbi:hypothetical protein ACIQI7_26900 [Kitasatospora sp. NPDC092039]|uniref:hypothetical protein n=1 Tax=Kitasatospora sp. NPDC092039 TaxID=3364086 RepID=UPI003816DEE2
MTREPVAPDDPGMCDYTGPQITALLGELHRRAASAGESTLDGRVLVDFGHAPVSTLLNLLDLPPGPEGERG